MLCPHRNSMPPSITQRIEYLLGSLPDSDIPIARKYFSVHDYEKIRELTTSAIAKIRKARGSSDTSKIERYAYITDRRMLDMMKLNIELDNYLALLDEILGSEDDEDEHDYMDIDPDMISEEDIYG